MKIDRLIPRPRSFEQGEGGFLASASLRMGVSGNETAAGLLADAVAVRTSFEPAVETERGGENLLWLSNGERPDALLERARSALEGLNERAGGVSGAREAVSRPAEGRSGPGEGVSGAGPGASRPAGGASDTGEGGSRVDRGDSPPAGGASGQGEGGSGARGGGSRAARGAAGSPAGAGSPEGYSLVVSSEGLATAGASPAGLLHAAATAAQLLERRGGRPFWASCEVADRPAIRFRGVHLDLKHHMERPEYLQRFVRRLASLKINALVLELEDKFLYRRRPEIGAPVGLGAGDLERLTDLCLRHNVELVPLVQGLGHAGYVLKHEKYAHLREREDSFAEFCPQREETYEILFDLYEEVADATEGARYFHIGGDEAWLLGSCPECAAAVERQGKFALFKSWLDRCAEKVRELGRTPMVWDDMLVKNAGEDYSALPEDLFYVRWDYEPDAAGRSARHVERYSKSGRKVVLAAAIQTCCPYFPCYGDHFANISGLGEAAAGGGLEGLLTTAWDDSGNHTETFWPGFALTAEVGWRGAAPEELEFMERFERVFHGLSEPAAGGRSSGADAADSQPGQGNADAAAAGTGAAGAGPGAGEVGPESGAGAGRGASPGGVGASGAESAAGGPGASEGLMEGGRLEPTSGALGASAGGGAGAVGAGAQGLRLGDLYLRLGELPMRCFRLFTPEEPYDCENMIDLPDLAPGRPGPRWREKQADRVADALEVLPRLRAAREALAAEVASGRRRNAYALEVLLASVRLMAARAELFLALRGAEVGTEEAFGDWKAGRRAEAAARLGSAAAGIEAALSGGERGLAALEAVWERTRLPQDMSIFETPERPYLHDYKNYRHYASKTKDLGYHLLVERACGARELAARLREGAAELSPGFRENSGQPAREPGEAKDRPGGASGSGESGQPGGAEGGGSGVSGGGGEARPCGPHGGEEAGRAGGGTRGGAEAGETRGGDVWPFREAP